VAERDAVDGCVLKSNDDDDDGDDDGPLLGYLAGAGGRGHGSQGGRGHGGGRACGSERAPWLVAAERGQRLRFTLMDFSSTAAAAADDDEFDVDHVTDDVTDDVVRSRKTSHRDNDGEVVVRVTFLNEQAIFLRYLINECHLRSFTVTFAAQASTQWRGRPVPDI